MLPAQHFRQKMVSRAVASERRKRAKKNVIRNNSLKFFCSEPDWLLFIPVPGMLIRILGDRFSWNVKLAVLETLSKLLVKV